MRDKMWFGMTGIDQVTSGGSNENGGYSYPVGINQFATRTCTWDNSIPGITCSAASAVVNLGMRNSTLLDCDPNCPSAAQLSGALSELPFVRLHHGTQAGDNAYIQSVLLQTSNPYQGNPDGLIDVFHDAIYYFQTDYPTQGAQGCGERYIIYLGAGLPRPGYNNPIEDLVYLRDTLKVHTYVVGLMPYTTGATDAYRRYMNALAVAGGGTCASTSIGGSDCAYLARYENPGCTDDATCDVLGVNDLRKKLGAVMNIILKQVSSRTRVATASAPVVSGSGANWRVNAAFQVEPTAGPWHGFLRATERDNAGTLLKTLDFHTNLDATSYSARRLISMDSANLVGSTGQSPGNGNTVTLLNELTSEWADQISGPAATSYLNQFITQNDVCLAHNFFDSPTMFYNMLAGATASNLSSAACQAAQDEATIIQTYQQYKLGDIYHSSPVVVAPPELFLNDASYQTFRAAEQNRPLTAYVGANDGMLHSFALEDDSRSAGNEEGTELWAYVPRMVIPALPNGIRLHREYVDSPPLARDIKKQVDSATSPSGWATVLLGSLGRGGAGFYALDVTEPAQPQVLWERSAQSAGFDGLAQAFGPPAIGRVFYQPPSAPSPVEVPVAFLQGGWDPGEVGTGYPSGRVFFIVNLLTGEIIKRFDASNVPGLDAPITGTASPYDDLPTSFVSRTFVGDNLGRIWRIDTSSTDLNNWNMARFWPVVGSAYDTNVAYQRPIFLAPALAFDVSHNLNVFWGTGNVEDLDNSQNNYFWGVREQLTLSGNPNQPPTVTSIQTWTQPHVFAPSEKQVGDPVVFNGVVLLSTFTQAGSSCAFGTGSLYALDMNTGGPKFITDPQNAQNQIVSFATAGTSDAISLGTGVPSAPVIRQAQPTATVAANGQYTFSGGNFSALVQIGAANATDQFTDTTIQKDLGPVARRSDILGSAEYE